LALALLFLLACALPFLGGLQGLLGIFIIGIGIYEAWKFNRRRVLDVSGPYALNPVGLASPAT
jgi:predicted transporter